MSFHFIEEIKSIMDGEVLLKSRYCIYYNRWIRKNEQKECIFSGIIHFAHLHTSKSKAHFFTKTFLSALFTSLFLRL